MQDNQKNAEQIADSIEPKPDRKNIASECKKGHRKIELHLAERKKLQAEAMAMKLGKIFIDHIGAAQLSIPADVLANNVRPALIAAYQAGTAYAVREMDNPLAKAIIEASKVLIADRPASSESEGS